MELAKVTSQGQITIPADIRRHLGLKGGDKVVLIQRDGYVVMANSQMLALQDELGSEPEFIAAQNPNESEGAPRIGAHHRK